MNINLSEKELELVNAACNWTECLSFCLCTSLNTQHYNLGMRGHEVNKLYNFSQLLKYKVIDNPNKNENDKSIELSNEELSLAGRVCAIIESFSDYHGNHPDQIYHDPLVRGMDVNDLFQLGQILRNKINGENNEIKSVQYPKPYNEN